MNLLGVDIGGTKTLFAVFDQHGKIIKEHKIATNKTYAKFLDQAAKVIKSELAGFEFLQACVAAPARIDRRHGIAMEFGNLNWHNLPIKHDFSRILGGIEVFVENDAKLAGLSEALLVKAKYKKVLYLTISTGIGAGIIVNGKIDPDFADAEVGYMMINHQGKIQPWEKFASGKALFKRYGQLAVDLKDAASWRAYSFDIAIGLQELLAVLQPDAVIFGGGVGAHFERFGAYLEGELRKLNNHMVEIPPLLKAKRPEEAVIYGCYDFIRQNG